MDRMMLNPVLSCAGLAKHFGQNRVLADLNLEIYRGEIVGLVGGSGCGKSTLLNLILGIHKPTAGSIKVANASGVLTEVGDPNGSVGWVPQRYPLYPFLTALGNVTAGLVFSRTTLLERLNFPAFRKKLKAYRDEAAEMLERMHMSSALDLYPHQMSGGMCQRVAIARALILKPSVVLLDEPFGALDEATRESMQQLLIEIYDGNLKKLQAGEQPLYTIMIVTHELREALYVSDRVIGLSRNYWRDPSIAIHPGATVVYDKVAPVFSPDANRDFECLRDQQCEIAETVLNTSHNGKPDDHVTITEQLRSGEGAGVLEYVKP